jgi:hypothetical protein
MFCQRLPIAKRTLRAILIYACVIAWGGYLIRSHAQTITGSITGTITDPSGAAISGAEVVATDPADGVPHQALSNNAGIYSILFLPPGRYVVDIAATGFDKLTIGPLAVEVNQAAKANAQLVVGSANNTVTVQASGAILQTESATTGGTISGQLASSLPTQARNFAEFTLLVPGAITQMPSSFASIGRTTTNYGGRPIVNGNREQTNEFLLDGQEFEDTLNNKVGYQPNLDAVEEIKVQTGNAGAEFGNANGAAVNMVTKSGGNKFHGSAFEYFGNDALNANDYFNKLSGGARPGFSQNIFGATLGGPIRQDKLFSFVDFEGGANRTSGPSFGSVAPPAWRTGDLSSESTVIMDPTTGKPFAGNIIPQARIVNPIALALLNNPALYPAPNNPGTGTLGVVNNYAGTAATFINSYQGDAKIDYTMSPKDTISGRFTASRVDLGNTKVNLPTTIPLASSYPTTGGVIGWTRVFSPSVVNEARFAFTRVRQEDTVQDVYGTFGTTGNNKIGIPGTQAAPGISQVGLGGTEGLTAIGTPGVADDFITNDFQYTDMLTKQYDRHLLKIGGQALRYQQNYFYAGNNGLLGFFTFSGTYTGSSFADFLLDDVNSNGIGSQTGHVGQRQWRDALFIQDDYKVRPNLTVNLGLRWEYSQPVYEVQNREININLTNGDVLYAGKDGNSRALYNSYWRQFMPRLGFAYSPSAGRLKSTVVRGGYGITTFMEGTGTNLRLPLNPPFFYQFGTTFPTNAPGKVEAGFTNALPANGIAGTLNAYDPNLRPSFTQAYNLTVEQAITPSLSLSAGYVGQRGQHLIALREGNQATVPSATELAANRPLYPYLPNVTNVAESQSGGLMSYNSLQVEARQRASAGMEFIASYTYSKSLSDSVGFFNQATTVIDAANAYWQNAYDRHAEWGPAFFDSRQNFSLGGTYQLPFGSHGLVGQGWNRTLDAIAGGWKVGLVVSAHTGFPITLQSTNNANVAARTARPNQYRLLRRVNQSVSNWFGTDPSAEPCGLTGDNGVCAYGTELVNTFGTAKNATERAPGYENTDLSLSKGFRFTESRGLNVGADFFNAFNNVSFGPPDRMVTDSTFGQITSDVTSPRNIQLHARFTF